MLADMRLSMVPASMAQPGELSDCVHVEMNGSEQLALGKLKFQLICEITARLEFRRWLVDCIETSDGKQEGSERRNRAPTCQSHRVTCRPPPTGGFHPSSSCGTTR
jgi:hypothetical protein